MTNDAPTNAPKAAPTKEQLYHDATKTLKSFTLYVFLTTVSGVATVVMWIAFLTTRLTPQQVVAMIIVSGAYVMYGILVYRDYHRLVAAIQRAASHTKQ